MQKVKIYSNERLSEFEMAKCEFKLPKKKGVQF
jgi:hypothetical protein